MQLIHPIKPIIAGVSGALFRTGMDDSSQTPPPPLFTFGVVSDIQYADIDDGCVHSNQRYYRNSLQLLRNALNAWSASAVRPKFILQLGDIIDAANKKNEASAQALDTVLSEFAASPIEVHHAWGNHEFYNLGRSALFASKLNSSTGYEDTGPRTRDIYAYHFSPAAGFRVVVLDPYDVSLIGRDEASAEYADAETLLKQHNANEDTNVPPKTEEEDSLERRFVRFNGGFSREQLDWLDGVLTAADERGERVAVAAHVPVHPGSTSTLALAWNYDELLAVLHAHRSVVCYVSGHDHSGGYHRDEASGVHYLILEGVVETPPGGDAFGTVSVYDNRMVLKGNGRVGDREMMFP